MSEANDFDALVKRFLTLRADLFAAIRHSLEQDGHCKSYEGRLAMQWPHYFEEEYTITLDCYVIGPSRHYYWTGKDFTEALDNAEKDIRAWIQEEYESEYYGC